MNFRPRRRDEPEINLIPFIDVLLVVLIFLMLTTTWSRLTEIQLNLPVADANPPNKVDDVPRPSRWLVVTPNTRTGQYKVRDSEKHHIENTESKPSSDEPYRWWLWV